MNNEIFVVERAPTVAAVPTLSHWGMILCALLLLTAGAWQLRGRPVLFRAAAMGGVLVRVPEQTLLRSLLVGQGVALLALFLYGQLIESLQPHDVIGAVLSGMVLGVLIECGQRGESRRR